MLIIEGKKAEDITSHILWKKKWGQKSPYLGAGVVVQVAQVVEPLPHNNAKPWVQTLVPLKTKKSLCLYLYKETLKEHIRN
jgi:hypothetical protein